MPKAKDFARVRRVAEQALDAARDDKVTDWGAVNWGDLGVVEVSHCQDEYGSIRWRVLIEEASPECALASHVYKALSVAFQAETFDVATEW